MKYYHNKHYHPDEYNGICVVARKDESYESLMKRFKKKFSQSGIAKEVRERMAYEKPCNERRRRKMQCIRNIQREEEKTEKNKEKMQLKKIKNQKLERGESNDYSNKRQSYNKNTN